MRKWLSIISLVIIFLVVAIIAAVWQFNRVLKSSHIENLHYQIQAFNVHEIKLSELSFVYAANSIDQRVHVQNLDANIEWHNFLPQIAILNVEQVSLIGEKTPLDLQPQVSPSQKKSPAFTLPKEWKIPSLLPGQIHLQKIVLQQPCSKSICYWIGKLNYVASTREQATINMIASPGESIDSQHQLRLDVVYNLEKKLPKLDAILAIDKSINLALSTNLLTKSELYWLGELKGSAAYLDPWWTPYLNAWNIKISPPINESPNSIQPSLSIQSNWQLALTPLLNLPADADSVQRKKAITGDWFLDAKIPSPMQILDFGQFSGQAKIDVEIVAGNLNRYAIAADINAEQLVLPDSLQALGLQVDSVRLNVQSKVENDVSLASLPVEFFGTTTGELQTKFSGQLLIDAFAKKVIFNQLILNGRAKKLQPYTGYVFENTSVDMHAVGYWQPDSFSFGLSEPGQLSTDADIKTTAVNMKSARLIAKQLGVAGNLSQGKVIWSQLRIDSDATLSIDKLSYPQLKPNSWRWHGQTKGVLEDFDVAGEISVGSVLNLQHHATLKASDVHVDWKMADVFLLAANPFADTIKQWPPLLSFARGKINASGNLLFDIGSKELKKSVTNIQLQDIAGIYDTTIFEGVNAHSDITSFGKTLKVTMDEIKVNQINKGFILGPFVASGIYQADWQKILAGKLTLKKFSGNLLDGTISTPAQVFDFSRGAQNLLVTLRQVNLNTLLQQHPASELSGSGQLSGDIPIEITGKGIRIKKGLVAADAPGGRLKYQSARAAELAKTQPSMKLLTEALSDFHYSVLSSEVTYDENGKLFLAVRLEGKNPKLENGRPVNLNVNLEEDLPALLASMQLSSKVTDVVKKRVQEYLQNKSDSKPAP